MEHRQGENKMKTWKKYMIKKFEKYDFLLVPTNSYMLKDDILQGFHMLK